MMPEKPPERPDQEPRPRESVEDVALRIADARYVIVKKAKP